MVRILLTVPLVVPLALVDSGAVAESDPRQAYRFVVTASGMGQIEFRGLLTVDGKVRVLPMQRTPYTFECEAGTTITGYIESLTPGRTLNFKVIEPAYSRRRAAASGTKLDRVRFAWARPGVGPRCIAMAGGEKGCPESVPGVETMRRLLETRSQTPDAAAPR